MTGFGEAAGTHDGAAFTWSIRSVNGKGLDMRLRLPQGMEALDPAIREVLRKAFSRGNLQVALQLERSDEETVLRVNEAALADVVRLLRETAARHDLEIPDAGRVLQMRGVLESGTADTLPDPLRAALTETLAEAVSALAASRVAEGKRLAEILAAHVDEIAVLTDCIADDPSRGAAAIRARLAEQIERLAEADLDSERLHGEAALLAVKADLGEEIDRLRAHVASARDLLAEGGPVGRRLEFLAQEFNREANTICSKANAAAVTKHGLELKVVIDRFREQVANVE